ncbi:hypothetical protein [Clostridium perfringens]|uniref:hypothetical protein n=1 Tax=Clostridium perfringens TaxID=1502 RepID=UPI0024BC6097|nr:hypothetical protein [Clostridium perfringens]
MLKNIFNGEINIMEAIKLGQIEMSIFEIQKNLAKSLSSKESIDNNIESIQEDMNKLLLIGSEISNMKSKNSAVINEFSQIGVVLNLLYKRMDCALDMIQKGEEKGYLELIEIGTIFSNTEKEITSIIEDKKNSILNK